MYPAFSSKRFLGMSKAQVENFFGYNVFLEKFGKRLWDHCETNLSQGIFHEELQEWQCGVWLGGQHVSLLCCSDDVQCTSHQRKTSNCNKEVCSNCGLPLCKTCEASIFHEDIPQQPCIALANDMWKGFGSKYVYES